MKQITTFAVTMLLALGLSATSAYAGEQMNPCNPCAMKQNPCAVNPCSMKNQANPCAMNPCGAGNPCSMNPCAGDKMVTLRDKAFNNFGEAVAEGKKMWNNENLGTSGLSCASCHSDYENLNLDKNQNYPHFVKMVDDVVTLDQMINYCMVNPMKGDQLEQNSKGLTALAAYYRAYRMKYLSEHRK